MVPFGAMVEIIRFLHGVSQGSTNLERKCYRDYSADTHLSRIFWSQTEELENLDSSEIHPLRINAKEVLTPRRNSKIVRKRPRIPRTPKHKQPSGSENLSGELQGEREEFQSTETKDDAEATKNMWSIQDDFIYLHHIELRVQLCAETRNIPESTEIH